MRLFTKIFAISAISLAASVASAAVIQLDGFDDASIAASSNAAPTNSQTVSDAGANDLFSTRRIKLTSTDTNQVANIQADMSVAGSLAYSAETGVKTTYEILYTLDAVTDLTLGKGTAGANDFLELFVSGTDFRASLDVRVNNTVAYTNIGEIPGGVGSTAGPGIASFNLSDFPGSLTSVSSLEFRIIPLNFLGFRAPSADGEFDFFQFNIEEAAVVPVPSTVLMLIAGLFGIRRFNKTA